MDRVKLAEEYENWFKDKLIFQNDDIFDLSEIDETECLEVYLYYSVHFPNTIGIESLKYRLKNVWKK